MKRNHQLTRKAGTRFHQELSNTRQTGVALITALLIISLVTIISVEMASNQQLSIRRTGNQLLWDQALQYAQGGEVWALGVLRRDLKSDQNTSLSDHLNEDWASKLPMTPIDGGSVGGVIVDMQSQFNVNNLYQDNNTGNSSGTNVKTDPKAKAALQAFKRLLNKLDLNPSIADALADWMDSDINVRFPDGAEDLDYQTGKFPYRAANRRLAHISELRLVKGVDQKSYNILLPYVTALPTFTTVNINTASAIVIASLAKEIDSTTAQDIVEIRDQTPYNSYDDFNKQLKKLLPSNKQPAVQLKDLADVKSNYFRIDAQVQLGKLQLVMHSAVYRSSSNETGILYRTQGYK